MATPRTVQRWADVETEGDFLAYLGAWHAGLHDHSTGKGRLRFRARTWAEVADALLMGQIYE